MITGYFDGACEPVNPGGHTGAGFVIRNGRKVIAKGSVYMGHGDNFTNNVGEAGGAIALLEKLLELGLQNEPITVYGDSQIMIRRLTSNSKPTGAYAPYCLKAQTLAGQFPNIQFVWIPRHKNVSADVLSKRAVADCITSEPDISWIMKEVF